MHNSNATLQDKHLARPVPNSRPRTHLPYLHVPTAGGRGGEMGYCSVSCLHLGMAQALSDSVLQLPLTALIHQDDVLLICKDNIRTMPGAPIQQDTGQSVLQD